MASLMQELIATLRKEQEAYQELLPVVERSFYFMSFCRVTTNSSITSSLPSRISLATQPLM